jgi:hypothetical protein
MFILFLNCALYIFEDNAIRRTSVRNGKFDFLKA